MKTMDIVKKRIITTMVAIILLVITLFGITYAFFISSVVGNEEESVTVKAGKLALEYKDGNGTITAERIIPGTVIAEKTFTVKNTGTHQIDSYEVIVENIKNDLVNYQDLTYVLTCKSYMSTDYEEKKDEASETGTCNGSNGIFPNKEDYLVRNSIDKAMTHVYELILTFEEINEDQSIDMKKTIEAKVNIIDDETNYKSILVYGNSIQDGTPSPTSPIEIESVGDLITDENDTNYGKYKIPINVEGKNLFDEKNIKVQFGRMQPTYENDCVLISHSSISTYSGTYVQIPIKAQYLLGKTITVSYDFMTSSESKTALRIGYEDISGEIWKDISAAKSISSIESFSKTSLTVKLPDSIPEDMKGEYFLISLYSNSTGQLTNASNNWVRYKNIQVEINSTLTTYEPYIEPVTYNIILNEPLRKVGDCENCADYIDLYKGKVYRNVLHNIIDISDSTLNITADNWQKEGHTSWYSTYNLDNNNSSYTLDNIMSNRFKSGKWGWGNAIEPFNYVGYRPNIIYNIVDNNVVNITDEDDNATKFSKIKNWFSNNPTEIILPLSETKEESIDLLTLPKIDKNSPILVETEIEPSKIETEY